MKYLQLRNCAVASVCFLLMILGIAFGVDVIDPDSEDTYSEVMAGEVQPGNVPDIKETDELSVDDSGNMDDNMTLVEEAVRDEMTEPEGVVAHITIPKLSDGIEVRIEDIYINRQLKVMMGNCPDGLYTRETVVCDNNIIKKIKVRSITESDTAILIEMDGVYVYEMAEEKDAYIITAREVHSVYDKVIVVDAGHGGKDVGCSSRDMKHEEKKITLDVVRQLKEKMDATDVKVYYTRLEDETVYLRPRATLANDVKADMFISLHCNYYDRYWLYVVNGSETLYSSSRKTMKNLNKTLAKKMLDSLAAETKLSRRSAIDRKKSLYILKESKVPSVIVELAYMSDAGDLEYLLNEKKRKKIVQGLYNGIVEAYSTLYGKNVLQTQ